MACPMSMHKLPKLESRPIFDHTSIFALSSIVALFATACSFSYVLLHKSAKTKIRILFTWHLFDALIHFTIESSYLYNVFFTSMAKLDATYTRGLHSTPMTPVNVSFLEDSKRLYGSFYGTSMTARLWQEYAKADTRWGGSDLTITSVEIITVLFIAPLALYVCHLLRKQEHTKAWFWMAMVATGELYGGLMTLLPEWLSGSTHLDISNMLTLWVYLFLFKALWALFPLWILVNAYHALTFSNESSTSKLSNGMCKSKPSVAESL